MSLAKSGATRRAASEKQNNTVVRIMINWNMNSKKNKQFMILKYIFLKIQPHDLLKIKV